MTGESAPLPPLPSRWGKTIASLHRRKEREAQGLFLAEGPRLVRAALDAGDACVTLRAVAVAGDASPEAFAIAQEAATGGATIGTVPAREFARLADTQTPQGILAVLARPAEGAREPAAMLAGAARVLVLDGVQDPGNVGTLLRSAAAFGVPVVLATHGTADPYAPKTVRSAMGGLFHLRVASRLAPEEVRALLAGAGIPLLVADMDGAPWPAVAWPKRWALAVGSEARGVSPELVAGAAGRVSIPQERGRVESLNAGVAGSILLAVACG